MMQMGPKKKIIKSLIKKFKNKRCTNRRWNLNSHEGEGTGQVGLKKLQGGWCHFANQIGSNTLSLHLCKA